MQFNLEALLDAAVMVVEAEWDHNDVLYFSCIALATCAQSNAPLTLYRRLMAPYCQDSRYGVPDRAWWNGPNTPENQLSRSIALLLAHEVLSDDPHFAQELLDTFEYL